MIKKGLSILVVAGLLFTMASCATIMHGTTQDVGISSTPTGAKVIVDDYDLGETPIVVVLTRKEHHFIRIEMSGYAPYETILTRSVSGWVWGNIVIGGLIGLAIDSISGGLYKLTPAEIEAVLKTNQQGALYKDDTLYMAVVLKPDANWEKIGQLQLKD